MNARYNKQIEALYMEMYQCLFLYGNCILQNAAVAEEAVQETFRIACMKPKELCCSENPKGWLMNTLKYVLSAIERNKAVASRIFSDYISAQAHEYAITEDEVDFTLLYQNVAELEEYRILKEFVIDGKSILEMAQARGISVVACKKRLQRAKEVLKKNI